MGNCGGRSYPDPKGQGINNLNECGKYTDRIDGIGYTNTPDVSDSGKVISKGYCVPHGTPFPVNLAAIEAIQDISALLVAGVAIAATGGVGALPVISAFGAIQTGEAIGETVDREIQDSKTKEYKDDINSYCSSIGDSTADPASNMWKGVDTVLDYCEGLDSNQCAAAFFYNPPSCLSSDQNSYTRYQHYGCCDGYCARDGVTPACIRQQPKNYPGNPLVCCFNDHRKNDDNTSLPDSCYEDNITKQRTCDPKYRDLAAPECQDKVKEYCLGNTHVPGVNNFLELWTPDSEINLSKFLEVNFDPINNPWKNTSGGYHNAGHLGDPGTVSERYKMVEDEEGANKIVKTPCLTAIARSIYPYSDVKTWEDLISNEIDLDLADTDSAGRSWARELMHELYNKYTKTYGSFVGAINQDGLQKSDQFKEIIGTVCGKYPFLCVDFLPDACNTVTSDQMAYLSPDVRSWCGCYMNEKEYKKYNELSIPTECTPACNSPGTIPLIDGNQRPKICKDTICVIDDLNINITDSTYPGGFNFNQLCRSCGAVDNVESTNQELLYDKIGNSNIFTFAPSTEQEKTYSTVNGFTDIININGSNFQLLPNQDKKFYNLQNFSLYLNKQVQVITKSNIAIFSKTGTNSYKLINVGGILSDKDPNSLKKNSLTTVYIGPTKIDKSNKFSPSDSIGIDVGAIPNMDSEISSFTNIGSSTNIIKSSTCSCVMPDNSIDVENSKIASFNLNQKCGMATCHDGKGNVIPCGGGSIEYTAMNTVEDSLVDFKSTMVQNRNNFMLTIVGVIYLCFTVLFLRIIRDGLGKSADYFSWSLIILFIIFAILSIIKIIDDDDDLSKYFQ